MTLNLDMVEKTFVYGDSFSSVHYISTLCGITQQQMWYHDLVEGELVDRTKVGKSPHTMFLQATHDAITHDHPVRMIVALGACQRLTVYTDGWNGEETLKDVDPNTPLPDPARRTTLEDCERFLDRAEANMHNIEQFHPTLIWANIYKDILDLALRCDSKAHELLILHMSTTPDNTWINKAHPLIAPLCEQAEALPNYITEHDSCNLICQRQGIRPVDHAQYGWQGHHGPEGQKIFGTYVAEKQPWN